MDNFDIEPTSKCTLECPLCDRTWFFKKFKKRLLHEINVEHITSFIGKNAFVNMCGNNGDPIYHSNFYKLCSEFKKNSCRLSITTNGSSRNKNWWQELSNILDSNDQVTFSIDGLSDTNKIYRKNSDWKSIMTAIEVLRISKVKLVWKFIVFSHNQHQIEEAKKMSKELGFSTFILEKSDRWLDEKDLMPDQKYIHDTFYHKEKIIKDKTYKANMLPKCLVKNTPKDRFYIDAEGNFYPCCWMGTYRYRYKSVFSPKLNKFNIATTTLKEILNNDAVKDFFNSTKYFESAHECCKIECGVSND